MTEPGWQKSTYSGDRECVELASIGDQIGVRDSKEPDGPYLEFTPSEIAAFIAGVKAGEFDDLR